MLTLYHCSPIAGLTVLEPHQPNPDDSPWFGLYLASSMLEADMWRKQLTQEYKRDYAYLYCVRVDPMATPLWRISQYLKEVRWHGSERIWSDQVWCKEALPCEQVSWPQGW